jgi:hypothetical protein
VLQKQVSFLRGFCAVADAGALGSVLYQASPRGQYLLFEFEYLGTASFQAFPWRRAPGEQKAIQLDSIKVLKHRTRLAIFPFHGHSSNFQRSGGNG